MGHPSKFLASLDRTLPAHRKMYYEALLAVGGRWCYCLPVLIRPENTTSNNKTIPDCVDLLDLILLDQPAQCVAQGCSDQLGKQCTGLQLSAMR